MKYTTAILLSVFSCVFCAPLIGQSASETETLNELEAYREQINELEVSIGRYDLGLIAPLAQLAEVAISLEQFDESHDVLDRAVQIYRSNEGLYTENQLPLLQMMAANSARRGDWGHVNDTLEHLLWLYTNKHRGLDSNLVDELMQLSDLHFEAIVGDDVEMQSFHFRKASEISWIAIRVAETIWQPSDERLPGLYYDLARQFYLQAIAMSNGGRIAYELREIVPESGWVRSRAVSKNRLYNSGVRLFHSMRQVYETAEPLNAEALAMVDLYLADWELVFGQKSAETSYQMAFDGLLESGITIDSLHEFFDEPLLIPVPKFYSSITQASTAKLQISPVAEPSLVSIPDNAMQFSEWSNAFPNVQYPLSRVPLLSDEPSAWNIVTFSFELAALEKISRWVRGRYITNRSVPQDFEIIEFIPESSIEMNSFTNKLHSMHFRPRLLNGAPQPSNGTMTYRFIAN
jgi:tetratricopeptide (TPR) repeat protein